MRSPLNTTPYNVFLIFSVVRFLEYPLPSGWLCSLWLVLERVRRRKNEPLVEEAELVLNMIMFDLKMVTKILSLSSVLRRFPRILLNLTFQAIKLLQDFYVPRWFCYFSSSNDNKQSLNSESEPIPSSETMTTLSKLYLDDPHDLANYLIDSPTLNSDLGGVNDLIGIRTLNLSHFSLKNNRVESLYFSKTYAQWNN